MRLSHLVTWAMLAGALALSGCSSGHAQQRVSFSSIQKGEVPPHGNNAARVSVIRNEPEWSKFWDLLYANYLPKPARPSVNFSERVVVAVVDAPRSTGGYSITITDIEPNPSGITVSSSQVSPGPACMVTQALTQPFHIVTTPVFSGVATLELSQSVNSCGP